MKKIVINKNQSQNLESIAKKQNQKEINENIT